MSTRPPPPRDTDLVHKYIRLTGKSLDDVSCSHSADADRLTLTHRLNIA